MDGWKSFTGNVEIKNNNDNMLTMFESDQQQEIFPVHSSANLQEFDKSEDARTNQEPLLAVLSLCHLEFHTLNLIKLNQAGCHFKSLIDS